MKLVDYSDSEDSDVENEANSPPPKPQHAVPPSKPAKKQIIVDLPKPSRAEDEGPLKKRPRTEGAGGLFSILPPPKRSNPTGTDSTSKENNGSEQIMHQNGSKTDPVTTDTPATSTPAFVPRSTQTKKAKASIKSVESAKKTASVSLFPLGPDLISNPVASTPSNPSTYEPLIAQQDPEVELPVETPSFVPDTAAPPPSTLTTADLDNYAAHILEGRHRKNRTIEIVDYNAAEIYAQNAAEKASGLLQDQIAPVRAIGTGRHQITQLLNNVQDQRESLEEAFAKGRRVRKESAAKYGW